jgi:tryptophan-rich sensory protein
MKYNKILAVFLFAITVIIAFVWDVFFFIVKQLYFACVAIDNWGDAKIDELREMYDNLRE